MAFSIGLGSGRQADRNPDAGYMNSFSHINGPAEYHAPWVQSRIVSDGTREQIIAWLVWNDPNGCYTDEDSLAEGFERLTRQRAVEIMKAQLLR